MIREGQFAPSVDIMSQMYIISLRCEDEVFNVDRLRDLEDSYEYGTVATENIERWLSGALPLVPLASVREFVELAPLDLVADSFWRQLPFGTGGVRGSIGFGPNRINETVVALTIQGHCDFMRSKSGLGRTVVIANDVREFNDLNKRFSFMSDNPLLGISSRSLARLAAEVYAGNGFYVMMMEPDAVDHLPLLTTPELSYIIRAVGAAGGVNMSASHNHPDDNGVKVYDENGGQYLPPFDEELSDLASTVGTIKRTAFADALSKGAISPIDTAVLDGYLSHYLRKFKDEGIQSKSGTSILFTPLSGCGGRTVPPVLDALGFNVHTPEREQPDSTFSAIPLLAPNPEVAESTALAKAEASRVGANLVLAADPDADRLGVEVFHGGSWVHLTGNQIATILAYYLLLDPFGPELRGGVYQTLVTTLAVPAIAARAGVDRIEQSLLVGYKYIGAAMQAASESGVPDSMLLAFAAEESHGYLASSELRDKDAVSAAAYLAALHERLSEADQTLCDYLGKIYEEVGDFADTGRSIVMQGAEGVAQIARIMEILRTSPPAAVGDSPVQRTVDFWDTSTLGPFKSETDRQARNLVSIEFEGGRLTVRPSGTEPKIKFYVQLSGSSAERAHAGGLQARADDLARVVYNDLLAYLDRELPAAGLMLPDVLPLEAKEELLHDVFPETLDLLRSGVESIDAALQHLRRRTQRLVPGSDATATIYPALAAVLVDAVESGAVTIEQSKEFLDSLH